MFKKKDGEISRIEHVWSALFKYIPEQEHYMKIMDMNNTYMYIEVWQVNGDTHMYMY